MKPSEMNLVAPGKTTYDARAMVRTSKRWTRLLSLGGMSLFLASCSLFEPVDQPLTTFDPQGPFAEQINGLFWPVFWIAVVVFVLIQGAILLIVFLFRDKGDEKEAKQIHGSPKLEVMWTVIPAIILAVISVPTVSAIFELTECGSDAMEVEVIGHQWWFEFRYPEEGIQTANVMVIPAGREVCAQMTSDDVIHNFWIPALNGKRYLIPGQTTLLRLQADEPGEFWGHCAEFCGLSHSLMRARVQAVSESDYAAWVEGQLRPAVLPAEGTPEGDGWEIFLSKGCTQCHTVVMDDPGSSNIIKEGDFEGPNLTHFASRNVFAGAVLPEEGQTFDEALKSWLAAPPEVKPGSYMRDFELTEQEIDSLIAWLRSNE